jgi:hypothetical protein
MIEAGSGDIIRSHSSINITVNLSLIHQCNVQLYMLLPAVKAAHHPPLQYFWLILVKISIHGITSQFTKERQKIRRYARSRAWVKVATGKKISLQTCCHGCGKEKVCEPKKVDGSMPQQPRTTRKNIYDEDEVGATTH